MFNYLREDGLKVDAFYEPRAFVADGSLCSSRRSFRAASMLTRAWGERSRPLATIACVRISGYGCVRAAHPSNSEV